MTEIRDIDLAEERALHRWWEIHHDAQADRPLDYTASGEVARVAPLPTPHPDFHIELFRMASFDVYVDWPARRRGAGSLLLGELELEDGGWTVALLRQSERRAAEIGQDRFYAAATARDGGRL